MDQAEPLGSLPIPHVLIFPLPLQGPVNSMLKLAELLCLDGLHVTFLITDFIHGRLLRHTDILSHFSRYPRFNLASISDGLPENHPRLGLQFMEMFDAMEAVTKPLFRKMLTPGGGKGLRTGNRRPVTCIIADGILGFTIDVAVEIGLPIIVTRTLSLCCLWVFFSLPKLVESGELPFTDNDLDAPIMEVMGMESLLRKRDLPSFCRNWDLNAPHIQLCLQESHQFPRAKGLILDTFEDLEGPLLSHIRTLCPNLYAIGPLHAHIKSRLTSESAHTSVFSCSFVEQDRSCLAWLDQQPFKSVIYVSFGSSAIMTKDQLLEFTYGLVNSGKRFLWVIRSDAITEKAWEDDIPIELHEGVNERGYIVGWAPQEEVLAHSSVGGFLTHSGWNSAMDSVCEGVPMICWPFFIDQHVNSRFVEKVWKLGLDMKDTCDRVTIEKMVKDLMEIRRDEFMKSSDRMADLAKQSVSQGGSSYHSLARLIEDIKSMSL